MKVVDRLPAVDALKGIGLLLVIFAHEIGSSTVGYSFFQVVYSFHMPLFFIMSGFTSRPCKDSKAWRVMSVRNFIRILFPCFVAVLTVLLLKHRSPWPSMAFVCAGDKHIPWCGVDVYAVGPVWFCFALYILRVVYDGLQLICGRRWPIIAIMLSIVGYVAGIADVWLPLCLDIALATIPFYAFGRYVRKCDFKRMPCWLPLLLGGVWVGGMFMTVNRCFPGVESFSSGMITARTMGIAVRSYPFYPIGFCVAGAAVFFFLWIVTKWSLYFDDIILRGAIYVGRFSFWLLLVHQFDLLWCGKIDGITDMARGGMRVGIDIFIFLLVRLIADWFARRYNALFS